MLDLFYFSPANNTTSSVQGNIAHSEVCLSSAITATLAATSSVRPLAAVKPRVHSGNLPNTAKRSLDNALEADMIASNTQTEKRLKTSSGEDLNFTGTNLKSGKNQGGTSSSLFEASVPTSETQVTRVSDNHENRISQLDIRSAPPSSRTHKNKRKPSTRLPSDRVKFPPIENSDLNQQQQIRSIYALHISNVSKIPTSVIPTNIGVQEPCLEELPELTNSAATENDTTNPNEPLYTSTTIKNIKVWPTNLNIVPKVEIRDLNVRRLKAWMSQNVCQPSMTVSSSTGSAKFNTILTIPDKQTPTAIQDRSPADAVKAHSTETVVLEGGQSSAICQPRNKEVDLELRSNKPCTTNVKDTRPVCDRCGFKAVSMRGLNTHMKRSHSEHQVSVQAKMLEVIKPSEPEPVKASIEGAVKPVFSENEAESQSRVPQGTQSKPVDTESTEADVDDSPPPPVPSTSKSILASNRKHCMYCEFRGKTHQAYLDHLKRRHPEIKDKESGDIVELECPVCQKSFPNGTRDERRIFQEHLEIHQGLRPFVCPYCERGFKDPMRLITHASVHNGEGYFDCVKCGERMKNQTNLALHSRLCK